jgi:hypothetical protein
MDELFKRHSAGMLAQISYEICLCTSGRNDLCSWQSLPEPKIVVTLIKTNFMQQRAGEAYMSRKITRISVSTTGLLLC